MSKATIINFIGWVDEKKPLFDCVNDQGRSVILQSATHPDDYTIGNTYHVADVDNENNSNKQRLIPEFPTSRWFTAQQLEKNLPYTLAKAYLFKDAYKAGFPGFRRDTVIGFNDNVVYLQRYGAAQLYRETPKNYESSIEAGDEVTVGFGGRTWGNPTAYAWVKRPELLLQTQENILEFFPNWIRINEITNTVYNLIRTWTSATNTYTFQPRLFDVGFSILGIEREEKVRSVSVMSGFNLVVTPQLFPLSDLVELIFEDSIVWDNTMGTFPEEFIVQSVLYPSWIFNVPNLTDAFIFSDSNSKIKVIVELVNGGEITFEIHPLYRHNVSTSASGFVQTFLNTQVDSIHSHIEGVYSKETSAVSFSLSEALIERAYSIDDVETLRELYDGRNIKISGYSLPVTFELIGEKQNFVIDETIGG
jgi:hypothetical protein